MSADASDKSFWLAYCKAIQQAIGPNPGSDSAIFFATKAQKGPAASPLIPPEYTNFGIYNLADNLLSANNLFYVPSTQNSYIRSLRNYLGYVDLGGSQSPGVVTRVVLTQKALDAALTRCNMEVAKAFADFQQQHGFGITGDQSFIQWYPTHAPAYVNALQAAAAAAADNKSALNDMSGPLAAQYNLDSDKLTQAMTSLAATPGISMAATSSTPSSAQDVLNAVNSNQALPAPKGIRYVPEYSSDEYVTAVSDWIQDPSRGRPGKNSIEIKMSDGKNTSESQFGQETLSGSLSFSYAPWVSFGANASSDHEEKLDQSSSNENDIQITVTYDEIRTVAVNPGSWNIGDPKSSYPKLKPGAPDTVKVLVAPTQLVVVRNLGYRIKFSNTLKSTFDKKVSDTKQAGGYVRVFGIPIQVGGDFKKTTNNTSHTATWDSTSGEFIVAPTDEGAFASIIAIRGDKIKTT
ncbi:hypothetical protein HER10_EVM0000358 [Colletotrichum scovillei]|uniref:uncharacterized protein n=1 Tax=Colletotrichum scovillei TaxID=1209932 RepID=UPI0015C3F6C9|nr:uncharacterized protein HER10_EVM0000358 [Colletotrichum scovillei]KAF4781569.1 hypothetical protein HER10_EVM0000358 [Colletotrichum scovillei]